MSAPPAVASPLSPAPAPGGVAAIPCEVAARRLWDYVDARLPNAARAEVDAHLAACEGCPPHFAFARVVRRALAESAAGAPNGAGPEADDALRARVRRALAEAGVAPAGGRGP